LAGWYIATEAALKDKRPLVRTEKRTLIMALRIVFVILLCVPLVWLVKAVAGVHYINQTQALMLDGERGQARLALDKARWFAPKNYASAYDYEARYRLDLLNGLSSARTAEERKTLYEEAHDYNDRAIELNPGFASFLNLKALIYLSGYPTIDPQGREKAEALLLKALAGNPTLLDVRLGLAHVYMLKGQRAKARQVLEDAKNHPVPKNAVDNYRASIKRMGL